MAEGSVFPPERGPNEQLTLNYCTATVEGWHLNSNLSNITLLLFIVIQSNMRFNSLVHSHRKCWYEITQFRERTERRRVREMKHSSHYVFFKEDHTAWLHVLSGLSHLCKSINSNTLFYWGGEDNLVSDSDD